MTPPEAEGSELSDATAVLQLEDTFPRGRIRKLEGLSPDPTGIFSRVRATHGPGTFLLESAGGDRDRYSIIGYDPFFTFSAMGRNVEVNGTPLSTDDPYELLRELFGRFHGSSLGPIPFSGGLVGYLSYDAVRYFERIGTTRERPGMRDVFPDIHMVIPSGLICLDHRDRCVYLVSYRGKPDEYAEFLRQPPRETHDALRLRGMSETTGREEFMAKVDQLKGNILDGDIFQAVLSRQLEMEFTGDPLEMYRALRSLEPSPYMFFLDIGGERTLMGASPEMLVKLKDRTLTSRPLAGTRPRGKDDAEDLRLSRELLDDPKERSEHVMLVDLHRNDMGRVSEYGSVKVTQFMEVERFSRVQHMVSTVVSRLREGRDAFDALKALFPAGTVSGAPKIRAMELINELEPRTRGPYAGAVGYMDLSGDMNFAITIRSIFTAGEHAYLQAGAGIVADSDPEREFTETGNKMKAILEALEVASHG